ncbi:hypothetical protein C7W88_17035 [Novosphingobium sp. THN1]|nr:hypothetical protein C7W88_17035 [Novosphingobium sp. THN1]
MKLDDLARNIDARGLPACLGNEPEPRTEAFAILEKGMVEGVARHGDETAHAAFLGLPCGREMPAWAA